MRVAILRRTPQFSVSMDVYADGLVSGLKAVRPDWTILEYCPKFRPSGSSAFRWRAFRWIDGVQKYHERYWRYPNRLNQLSADLFHIIDHSDGYLSPWLHKRQRPNVVTCHDLINLIKPETFKGHASLPLVSMTLWKWAVKDMRQASHIIAVSSHTKQDVVEHLSICPQDITTIPNAVDSVFRCLPPDEIQAVRRQYNLSAETLCLLNVGSNNSRKNISTILDVVAELVKQGVPIQFWKAGADFSAAQKQFIQSHQLDQYITYLGKPDEDVLVQLYNAADCLMAPSLYEGFGLTILEAMACGTPVITANVTAMPEVAGEAAILVNPLNVKEMVQAIHDLYTYSCKRQALARMGLDRARQFTWENTAEQVAQVYEKVLAKERSLAQNTSWPEPVN